MTQEPRSSSGGDPNNPVDSVRNNLEKSVETFTGSRFDDGIADVTADSTGLSIDTVRARLSEARSELDTLAKNGEIGDSRIQELRSFASFMEELLVCQEQLIVTYQKHEAVKDAVYSEQFEQASTRLEELQTERESAASRVETFEAETDVSDLRAIDSVTTLQYQNKLDQFKAEVAAFETIQSPLEQLNLAVEAYAEAAEEYAGRDWRAAQSEFIEANSEAGKLSIEVVPLDLPSALSGTERALNTDSTALQKGTDLLGESAQHGFQGDDDERRSDGTRGLGEINGSPRLGEMPSTRDIESMT